MKMRIAWMMALLVLGLTLPVFAQGLQIQGLLVRRQGASVNVRVDLRNDSPVRQGPIRIDLYVRETHGGPWQQVKEWNDVQSLLPGYRVARDFFDEDNALLRRLAARGAFEVRAVVLAPGSDQVEQITSWQGGR